MKQYRHIHMVILVGSEYFEWRWDRPDLTDTSKHEVPSNLEYKAQQISKLNVSRLVPQLPLLNPLKPGVKSRMKMLIWVI